MNKTNILLVLLCVLVLWNILDQRGIFERFHVTPDYTPWLLWVNTYYYTRQGISEWEVEDTFDSKQECLARLRSGLRMIAMRSAIRESSMQDLSPKDWSRTRVNVRGRVVLGDSWDEKQKRWENVYSMKQQCLPNGTDPRPKVKE